MAKLQNRNGPLKSQCAVEIAICRWKLQIRKIAMRSWNRNVPLKIAKSQCAVEIAHDNSCIRFQARLFRFADSHPSREISSPWLFFLVEVALKWIIFTMNPEPSHFNSTQIMGRDIFVSRWLLFNLARIVWQTRKGFEPLTMVNFSHE